MVDIGSNTVRMHLYLYEKGKLMDLMHKKKVAGLASYVKGGYMTNKGIKKLLKILKDYQNLMEILDIPHNYFFATAAIRNTENARDILELVEKQLKIDIDLLSGEEEAAFGYAGIREEYQFDDGIIVDIGGGSTEITILEDQKIRYTTSMKEGSLSLKTKFVKGLYPRNKEIKNMEKYIKKLIEKENLPEISKKMNLYGIGGTIRSCGNISQEYFDLNSAKKLGPFMVDSLYHELKNKDKEAMTTVLQVSPERLHTILPGMAILKRILKETQPKEIYISKKGIREGYLKSRIKADEKGKK